MDGIPVKELDSLVSQVEEMILKDLINRLPGLNCKRCGFPSCEALAHAVSKGEATLADCIEQPQSGVNLSVNGKTVYLSSFPGEFIRNTVLGMVASLKGVDKTGIKKVRLDVDVQA